MSEQQEAPKEAPISPIEKSESDTKASSVLKNIFFALILLAVIIASFMISFSLGKKLLSPVRKLSEKPAHIEIPTPPASLEAFVKQGSKPCLPAGRPALPVVKKKSASVKAKSPVSSAISYGYYKVVAGSFGSKGNASTLVNKLNSDGFTAFTKKVYSRWRVQAGAYKQKYLAQKQVNALKQKGFSASIIYEK